MGKYNRNGSSKSSKSKFEGGGKKKFERDSGKSKREEKAHIHPKAQIVCTKILKPKTKIQGDYIKAMECSTITLGIGPAGTGKTVLAVFYAIQQIFLGKQKKIIITRPIVEAGENLGFLPGDLNEKVDPYIRPIMDALRNILGEEDKALEWIGHHLEIAPLAYMRGRTFDDSVLILDEAQNATKDQLFMFLTRIGDNTKAIVTADVSQIDLKRKSDSGIFEALTALVDEPEISIIKLSEGDIIRSAIVSIVVNAYKKTRQEVPAPQEVVLYDDSRKAPATLYEQGAHRSI
jgi:phosphate starvation-inducible PhoH-like protein